MMNVGSTSGAVVTTDTGMTSRWSPRASSQPSSNMASTRVISVMAKDAPMQVRRPIHREAIGSAEPYRQFLGPFLDAYYG